MALNIQEILDKKQPLTKEELYFLENYEQDDDQNRLYSFFTPVWLCKLMLELAIKYGFDPKKGKVLEPAAGNGNFLSILPDPDKVTAFELDRLNFDIANKRVPGIKHFFNRYFETSFLRPPRFTSKLSAKEITHLSEFPFDLVIGNPPYGKYRNLYSSYFKSLKFKQTELFFMYQSMRLLKKGGLLVFITSSSFMRNDKTYGPEKEKLSEIAEFVDAYRMPKVFKNTQVPTDILVFRRK